MRRALKPGLIACLLAACDDGPPGRPPETPDDTAAVEADTSDETGCADPQTAWTDLDADGYGDPDTRAEVCEPGPLQVVNGDDCDDLDADVHPGAEDLWYDGVDADCAGNSDYDADGDGYDHVRHGGTDCYDHDPTANQGGAEVWYDGIDGDCDGWSDFDADGDGWDAEVGGGPDCDDADPSIRPDAAEICADGIDNDCDGTALGCGIVGSTSLSDAALRFSGEAPYDYVGGLVAGVGDLDGDGRGDVLVGAVGVDSGATWAGAGYVLLSGGALAGPSGDLALADARLTGEDDEDRAGNAAAGVDLDGDGFGDLLLAASMARASGAVYLLHGPVSGASSLADADATLVGEADDDRAGDSVATADVDGDGTPDLLIGAYQSGLAAPRAGAVYLVLGDGALGPLEGDLELGRADTVLTGSAEDDLAGRSVASLGDVDGDGLDDAAVGTYGDDTAAEDAGAACLLLGGGALSTTGSASLSSADATFLGEAAHDGAGWRVAGAGDMDGDGLSELLVNAVTEDSGGLSAGATYVLLSDGALAARGATSLALADAKLTGESGEDSTFGGHNLAGAGDLDDDGLADIAIGAAGDDDAAPGAGAVYVVLGGGALSPFSGTSSLALADARLLGEGAADGAGQSAAGAGDVDGDGYSDLAVGASAFSATLTGAGAAYLVSGGPGL